MRNLVKPIWGLLLLVLPNLVFFVGVAPTFIKIESIQNNQYQSQFQLILIFLVVVTIVGILFTAFHFSKKQNLSNTYVFSLSALFIPFVWIIINLDYIFIENNALRSQLDSIRTYLINISSINLLHGVYILSLNSLYKNESKKTDLKPNIGLLLLVIWLGIFQIVRLLFNLSDYRVNDYLLLSFAIIISAILLFFLLKWSLKESDQNVDASNSVEISKRLLIAGFLPLFGLFLNNSLGSGLEDGLFGNFNSIWFYLIPLLNTVIICLPNRKNLNFILFSYIAKSITLSYVLYFVIIFIPILPIGMIGIIVLGAGLLTLVPYLLLAIQVNLMQKDFQQLQAVFSPVKLWLIFIGGFLVIPTVITLNYVNQQKTINTAFEYVFYPDYHKTYNIKSESFEGVLNTLKTHEKRNGGFFSNERYGIPILSNWFNYLVLDHKMINDETTGLLKKIFLDEEYTSFDQERPKDKDVVLQNFKTESIYDADSKQWQTWLHLDLKNNKTSFGVGEFISKIKVPENCLINNYYLYVGQEKKYGMHTERNSAIELYKSITRAPRDPGLVYYHSPTEVILKVFPFQKDELRTTGILFLHKDVVNIEMEGYEITLGIPNSENPIILSQTGNQIPVIQGVDKINLPVAQRQAYFHFLVDASAHAKEQHTPLISTVEALCKQYPNLVNNAEISFVGSNIITRKLEKDWKENYQNHNFSGSYFVDRAIKKTLVSSFEKSENRYPIMVMVSNHFNRAILSNHYAEYDFCFPESPNLYSIKPNQALNLHSLLDKSAEVKQKDCAINFQETTLLFTGKDGKKQYLPKNLAPSLLFSEIEQNINLENIKPDNWADGMLLKAKLRAELLNPQSAQKNWLSNLKLSFKNQILTSQTAFMVVETQAQEEMMAKKHKEILSGKADYFHSKDTMSMPEPGSWAFVILLIAILAWRIRLIAVRQSAQT